MRRIVVVGAGLAGLRAAETLREKGFDGELVLVGDEAARPYNRPPLSKQILAGTMLPEQSAFACDTLAVDWALGKGAAALDCQRQVVTLSDGQELAYDGLLIATGRRARPWPELPALEGFHTLRSLDDTLALGAAVTGNPRVVIIGAGFIGCEVAATLRGRGVDGVTLVDIAAHPMPRLGTAIGERAAALHTERGVKLCLNSAVESFEGNGRVTAVNLSDGQRLPADVVLLALGSMPNTDWLRSSGLELLRGNVLCDEYCMATGHDNIAAAGDMAAWPHPLARSRLCVEHWTNAAEMARSAAANLLAPVAERVAYTAIPTFWSDQYEIKIKSVGLLSEATEINIVEEDRSKWRLIAEARRDGELIGAIVFNKNRAIIDYQRRLREQLPETVA
ncbi:MAG: FAD-dependent oxidoreductase [Sinobacteraceae bacterium]|nr:FAD-dependent oxidoreductase [Nevskiaceae bacterium]